MDVLEEIDLNLICYLNLSNMVRHCGKYHSVEKNQWMEVDYGSDLDLGLTPLENVSHIIKMLEGVRNQSEVELYFQHPIVEDFEFVEMVEEKMIMLDKVIESTTNLNVGSQWF
jgi:hypothetical protein